MPWNECPRSRGIAAQLPWNAQRDKIKELERELRQLRQANEILRKASAYFAQAPFAV
jgi:transposase-like protein